MSSVVLPAVGNRCEGVACHCSGGATTRRRTSGRDGCSSTTDSDVDQFGRTLRYVETVDGDDARAGLYADLQRDAQRDARGLWAEDACGASDLDGVEIVIDVNADAPGAMA